MRVQNSIFIGEVFPIEVSDGLVHSLGSCQKVNLYPARVFMEARFLRTFSLGDCQKVNLYPARVFTGARVLRTLHTFTVRNDHSNVCTK